MTTEAKQQETHFFDEEEDDDDDDEDIENEEVGEEDDDSPQEGEEDIEAKLKTIQQQSCAKSDNQAPAVDDFVRNFLARLQMKTTLDCFQTEWNEIMHKGAAAAELVDLVPGVYTENQRLDSELRRVQRERDGYKAAALAVGETLAQLQKARDFHRTQHKRVAQEKNRLISDLKKLKIQCESYQPALKQITERYQNILKQKMLVSLERDRALGHASSLQAALQNMSMCDGGKEGPEQEMGARAQVKGVSKKTDASLKHPKDSDSPVGRSAHSLQSNMIDKPVDVPTKAKTDNFHLSSTVKAHMKSISCLAAHPTKLIVASSSDDHLWKLWGLPEEDMIATGEGHTDWLSGITFHPDGTKLGTTGADCSLRIWDLLMGRMVLTLQGHARVTWGCSFHSCGDFVASCSLDHTVKVWDLQSEQCCSTLRGHINSVNSVEFLRLSNTLLTSSADKTLSMWDARAACCFQTLCGHSSPCNYAAFTNSGRAIASCDTAGIVMLWDVRNLMAPTAIVETGPKSSNQVTFDPRDQVLAVAGGDNLVSVIDLTSNQVVDQLSHGDAVQSVVFDHRGEYLLSGASDGKIYIWS